MNVILIRSGISIVLLVIGYLAYRILKWIAVKRTTAFSRTLVGDEAKPVTIVYFTTPDCIACRSAQKPALEQLKSTLGERLKIMEIDAYQNPDMAREWGVMSVPVTFVLDREGKTKEVNFGVAPFTKLFQQVNKLAV